MTPMRSTVFPDLLAVRPMRLHSSLQGTSESDAPPDVPPSTTETHRFPDRGVGRMLDDIHRFGDVESITVDTPDAVYRVLVEKVEGEAPDDRLTVEDDPRAMARREFAAMGCTNHAELVRTPVRRFRGRTFGIIGGIKALYHVLTGKHVARERSVSREQMREIADVVFPVSVDQERHQSDAATKKNRAEARAILAALGYDDWESIANESVHTFVHRRFGSRTGPLSVYSMVTGKKCARFLGAHLREIADVLYPRDPDDVRLAQQTDRRRLLEGLRSAFAERGYHDWSSLTDAQWTAFSPEKFGDFGGPCAVFFLLTGKHIKTINKRRIRVMADHLFPRTREQKREDRVRRRSEREARQERVRKLLKAQGFPDAESILKMPHFRRRRFEGIGSVRMLYHEATGARIAQNQGLVRAHLREIVDALFRPSQRDLPAHCAPGTESLPLDDVLYYQRTATTGRLLSTPEEREMLEDLSQRRDDVWMSVLRSPFMRRCSAAVIRAVATRDLRAFAQNVRVGWNEKPEDVLADCASIAAAFPDVRNTDTPAELLRRPLALPAMRRVLTEAEQFLVYLRSEATNAPGFCEKLEDLAQNVRALTSSLQHYEEARNAFALYQTPFVIGAASAAMKHRSQMADLIGEGGIQLLEEIERFDASSGFHFGTLAARTIRWHLKKVVREDRGTVRIPQDEAKKLDYIRLARFQLQQELGYVPDLAEAARRKGLSPVKCDHLVRAERCATMQGHLDLFDVVPDVRHAQDGRDEAIDPRSYSCASERTEAIERVLAACPRDIRDVLELRFGLNGYDGRTHTQKEIARILGKSMDAISRLEHDGLDVVFTKAKELRIPLVRFYQESVVP